MYVVICIMAYIQMGLINCPNIFCCLVIQSTCVNQHDWTVKCFGNVYIAECSCFVQLQMWLMLIAY
jgi:hypothetical protein